MKPFSKMATKNIYCSSELISFFAQYDPPDFLNDNCPVFTPEIQSPLDFTNFVPNMFFSSKPFNENPKIYQPKTGNIDWKPQKIVDFQPTHAKQENSASNQNFFKASSTSSLQNQQNQFEFKPKSITEQSDSPPVHTPKQSNESQNQTEITNDTNQAIEPKMHNNPQQLNNQEIPQPEIHNTTRSGFRPQKAQHKYEAPDYLANPPKSENQAQSTKAPSFDEIEKEEKSNQQKNKPERKSYFDSLYEEEKRNAEKVEPKQPTQEKEIQKQPIKNGGFRPAPARSKFEGVSISEIEAQTKPAKSSKKSAFELLMEEEKAKEQEMKAQKEQEKKQPKPSIIDALIEEEKRNKARELQESPPPVPEEKEKPQSHGFNPKKATTKFEALSIAELERIEQEKKKQEQEKKKAQYIESSSTSQKPSFNQMQKQENQKKKTTGPSFLDLMQSEQQQKIEQEKEQKRLEEIEQKKEAEKKVSSGFNPKRRTPMSSGNQGNSFAALLNQEKENEAKKAPTFGVAPKRNSNMPSFNELMISERRKEEERAQAPIQHFAQKQSFAQNLEEAENAKNNEEHQTKLGEFVSYQGDKRKKRGGKNGNNRGGRNAPPQDEKDDLFWGIADKVVHTDPADNQFPSFEDTRQETRTEFGFKEPRRPEKIVNDKAKWLARVLEEEIGEDDPYEFAESLINKTKKEMIRFLSTVTIDHHQAIDIADRFFGRFPSK